MARMWASKADPPYSVNLLEEFKKVCKVAIVEVWCGVVINDLAQ